MSFVRLERGPVSKDTAQSQGQALELLAETAVNSPGDWKYVGALHKTFVIVVGGTKTVSVQGGYVDPVTGEKVALPSLLVSAQTASGAFAIASPVSWLRANPTDGGGTARVLAVY